MKQNKAVVHTRYERTASKQFLKALRTYIIGNYQDYWPSFSRFLAGFFEKHFMAILFTLRVFARNLLRGNRRRNTFCILFWCLAWGSNPGFMSNKPTHCLLHYGESIIVQIYSTFKFKFVRLLLIEVKALKK